MTGIPMNPVLPNSSMNTVRYCLVLGSLISLATGKLIAKMIARISRQTTSM